MNKRDRSKSDESHPRISRGFNLGFSLSAKLSELAARRSVNRTDIIREIVESLADYDIDKLKDASAKHRLATVTTEVLRVYLTYVQNDILEDIHDVAKKNAIDVSLSGIVRHATEAYLAKNEVEQ